MSDNIDETVLKIIRLSDKFENLKRHCDEMNRRMEKDLAWRKDIKLLEKDIHGLRTAAEKNADNFSWLLRGLFFALVSSGLGLIVWLIQNAAK
jgi:predicted RNase H-like nuclease (RuvC/YqgF family)